MLFAKVHVVINPLLPEHLLPHGTWILVNTEVVRVLKPVIERVLGDRELRALAPCIAVRLKRILLPTENKEFGISHAQLCNTIVLT